LFESEGELSVLFKASDRHHASGLLRPFGVVAACRFVRDVRPETSYVEKGVHTLMSRPFLESVSDCEWRLEKTVLE